MRTSKDKICVLLDTSFCIRLLNENDPLHSNALGFYRSFRDAGIRMKLSTISVAEYCVKGKLGELPLKNVEVVPFNINHAVKAAEFAQISFDNKGVLKTSNRLIIPNDTKLFAQAHSETLVTHFASSDLECTKMYNLLTKHTTVEFEIMNISEPYSSVLGVLPFEN